MPYDVQFGVVIVFGSLFERVQRRVMIYGRFECAVIIVRQQIEPVKVLVQLRYVVTFLDVLCARRNGHRQQQARPSGLGRLALEFLSQLLHELGVIIFISGLPAVPIRRILPIQIHSIKVILSQEFDNIFDEIAAPAIVRHHRREPRRAFVPSADREHNLQLLIVRLQAGEFGVAPFLDILVFIERLQVIVFGETAECVDQMRAQVRVDVLRTEFRRARTVDAPVCVIANDARLTCLAFSSHRRRDK